MLTHCRRGHEMTEANTYRWRDTTTCRACRTMRGLRKYKAVRPWQRTLPRKANGQVACGVSNPALASTETPTTLDIVWAAGIYEGEGTVHKYSGQISVGQKDMWLLHKLKRLFGGSIGKPNVKSHVCEWTISGSRARGFGMTIYQFLSPRRKAQLRERLLKGVNQ